MASATRRIRGRDDRTSRLTARDDRTVRIRGRARAGLAGPFIVGESEVGDVDVLRDNAGEDESTRLTGSDLRTARTRGRDDSTAKIKGAEDG